MLLASLGCRTMYSRRRARQFEGQPQFAQISFTCSRLVIDAYAAQYLGVLQNKKGLHLQQSPISLRCLGVLQRKRSSTPEKFNFSHISGCSSKKKQKDLDSWMTFGLNLTSAQTSSGFAQISNKLAKMGGGHSLFVFFLCFLLALNRSGFVLAEYYSLWN